MVSANLVNMSELIPEKRLDINGRLVTRHVKAGAATAADMSSIPAPVITVHQPVPPQELSVQEMIDAVSHNLTSVGYSLNYDRMELLEGTKTHSPRVSLLKALYDATDGIDLYGAQSLMSGVAFYRPQNHSTLASCLELSARAYKFARAVDEASALTDNNHSGKEYDRSGYEWQLGEFTKQFFSSDLQSGSDPDDVIDIEGAYLLDRIGLNEPSYFNSKGAYYRSFRKIHDRKEEITEYLPLLIAAHLTDRDNYYLTLHDMFWTVDSLKNICPPEKALAVAKEALDRDTFDLDVIQEIASSDSTALGNGVL